MDIRLEKIFSLFLKKNFYYIDEKEVKLQLESHPDYPSLRSITDTLDYLEIEHAAISVPKDAYSQLPDTFLAMLEDQGKSQNNLVLLEKSKDKAIIHQLDSKEVVPENEFVEKWSGVIIAVEPNTEKAASNRTLVKFLSLKGILALVFLGLTASFVFTGGLSLLSILYSIISLAGIAVSVMIIREEFGQQSQFVNKICNATQATSCQEVLNSSGAKFYKNIGLSDLALVYFTTVTAVIVFNFASLDFMLIFSSLSIPVILYTIYSQAFVIKKWCVLCLSLSFLVLSQLTITALNFDGFNNIDFSQAIKVGLVGSLVLLVWLYVKPLLVAYQKGIVSERDLLKFKKDLRIFSTLLKDSQSVDFSYLENDQNIIIGNPNAAIQLISVTNPMCGYCKPAFEEYDKILNRYQDKISVSFKFNVFLQDPKSPGFIVAKRVIETYQEKGDQEALKAIRSWFADKDIKAWVKQWGEPEKPAEVSVLENHKEWSLKNEINYTPATILSGKVFPSEYKITDLTYFIEELSEPDKVSEMPEVTEGSENIVS